MFNVDEQIARIEQLYRQLAGVDPRTSEPPVAPIPSDVDPQTFVQENLQRLNHSLQALMQRSAPGPMSARAAPQATLFVPRMNIFESDNEWRCAVELPGVRHADVKVQVSSGILFIAASRRLPGFEDAVVRTVRSETPACRFERSVALPFEVQVDSAEAHLELGLLTVRMRKQPMSSREDFKIEVA